MRSLLGQRKDLLFVTFQCHVVCVFDRCVVCFKMCSFAGACCTMCCFSAVSF